MINFILRYLMPSQWRWNKFMEDAEEIQRRRRDRNPYYIGIAPEELMRFHDWLNRLLEESQEYWRV